MTPSAIHLLAQFVAERVVSSLFGGLLIAAFAWLVLRIVGRQSSETRFAVWFSALVAIAVLPFVPSLGRDAAVTHAMHAELTLPWFWAGAILAAWLFFVTLAAARVLVGLWNLRRLRSSGIPLVPSQLDPVLRETLAQCEAIRPVTVCSSTTVNVPTAIGFFKPVILIPAWTLRDLPVDELKVILLHEFAHLHRRDDWTNLAQKIVRAVFFFHPAVWWIEKRLSIEREMACDDAVLAKTSNPRAYAECLVSLAEKSFVQRTLAMAHAAVSHARETSLRLARILDNDRPRATRVFKPALALMAAFAAACLLLLPEAPKLVAFESAAPIHSALSSTQDVSLPAQAAVVPVTMRTRVDDSSSQNIIRKAPRSAQYRPSKAAATKPGQPTLPRIATALPQRVDHPLVPMPIAAKEFAPAPEFVFVMQTAEFDGRGSVVLNVTVWRVFFATPNRNAIQQGVKSI